MVTDPTSLKTVLQMALGENGTVKKTRMLSHYNQTRIHVDEVVGLGNFLELEVSLSVVVYNIIQIYTIGFFPGRWH